MAEIIEAIYENGVFVPIQPPKLAEHDRVRLTVEAIPVPERSPVEVLVSWEGKRIHLDPDLADAIASDPAFLPEEC